MSREKISYLIDVNFERGGAPISTKILAEGMCNWYDVCIMKPYNALEAEDVVQILPIEEFSDCVPHMLFHPFKWLYLCSKLEKIIKSADNRILHAHMPNVGMALGFLKMRGKISPSTKLVYTDREHVAYLRWIHRIRYEFFIASQYDAVITLSETSRAYWKKKVKTARVEKIYNTASEEFEGSSMSPKHHSLMSVIMVGRVASDKGWQLGIEIIKKSKKYRFVVVMSYFDEAQKAEADDLLKAIRDFSNVKIYFNLPLGEIKKLYQQSDILVMPSRRESFGRTAVEAMSQRCVVIGTQVGGLPEVIGKPENCLPRETDAFCERLDFYSRNPDDLEEDKNFFFKRYSQNFSMEQNINKHRELYNALLAEKK